eukprot:5828331-Pyramimonas_sp.AAC.1
MRCCFGCLAVFYDCVPEEFWRSGAADQDHCFLTKASIHHRSARRTYHAVARMALAWYGGGV